MGKKDNKDNKLMSSQQYDRYIKFVFLAAIIVLINIISTQLFFRVDITDNQIFSLSGASKRAVSTLEEPLTLKAFFSNDLPANFQVLRQYLEDMLNEYALYGKQNFNFRFYNVGGEGETRDEEQNNRTLASEYGISPIRIQIQKNDALTFREAYMGMAMIHGDVIETLNEITSREKLEYTITSTIQKMNNKISALLSLDEKIKVNLILSSRFKDYIADLKGIPSKIEDIVDKLNKENYNKLTYVHIDPSRSKNEETKASQYNAKSFRAGTSSGGEPVNLYADLIIEFKDRLEQLNFLDIFQTPFGTVTNLSDEDSIEEAINNTVTNLININENIGYLADHGSVKLNWSDYELQNIARTQPNVSINRLSAKGFKELLSDNFTIKEFNIKEKNIPDGIECLIIAGPKEDFSEWELFQIDQFLMQGKSIAFFIDGLKEVEPEGNQQMYYQQPQKMYPPLNTGLEKLLQHYGATIKNSYVFDKNCYIEQNRNYGEINIYYVPVIQNDKINDKVKFIKNIKGLVMIQNSPLTIYEEKLKEAGIKADILFSSSDKSWEERENINLDDPTRVFPPAEDKLKSYPLACIMEGQFNSYFKDKAIPERPKKESTDNDDKDDETKNILEEDITAEEDFIEKCKTRGKIFLTGSSEILKDLLLSARGAGGSETPNRILISNILDYLNNREDYAVMRSKLQIVNPLDAKKTTPIAKDFTRFFNLIGLPLIVALFGLLVFLNRLSKRKKIQSRFSK